jgi:hypothetical protein
MGLIERSAEPAAAREGREKRVPTRGAFHVGSLSGAIVPRGPRGPWRKCQICLHFRAGCRWVSHPLEGNVARDYSRALGGLVSA